MIIDRTFPTSFFLLLSEVIVPQFEYCFKINLSYYIHLNNFSHQFLAVNCRVQWTNLTKNLLQPSKEVVPPFIHSLQHSTQSSGPINFTSILIALNHSAVELLDVSFHFTFAFAAVGRTSGLDFSPSGECTPGTLPRGHLPLTTTTGSPREATRRNVSINNRINN